MAESSKGQTRDKLAKEAGVSHGTLDKIKYAQEHAPEEVKEKARAA